MLRLVQLSAMTMGKLNDDKQIIPLNVARFKQIIKRIVIFYGPIHFF